MLVCVCSYHMSHINMLHWWFWYRLVATSGHIIRSSLLYLIPLWILNWSSVKQCRLTEATFLIIAYTSVNCVSRIHSLLSWAANFFCGHICSWASSQTASALSLDSSVLAPFKCSMPCENRWLKWLETRARMRTHRSTTVRRFSIWYAVSTHSLSAQSASARSRCINHCSNQNAAHPWRRVNDCNCYGACWKAHEIFDSDDCRAFDAQINAY